MSTYLPPQHGAWAFLGLPLALAAVVTPWNPLLPLLALGWIAAYPPCREDHVAGTAFASRAPQVAEHPGLVAPGGHGTMRSSSAPLTVPRSRRSTPSAPAGTTAPVAVAAPRGSLGGTVPASTEPDTNQGGGPLIAQPSIADTSAGGRPDSVTASAARTAPPICPSGRDSVGAGRTELRASWRAAFYVHAACAAGRSGGGESLRDSALTVAAPPCMWPPVAVGETSLTDTPGRPGCSTADR
jgi:hypothetical protein